MTIIESIREYFGSCPLLEGGRINVNYLPPDMQEYAVTPIPGPYVRKRYVTGDGLFSYPFALGMSAWIDADMQQAIDNSGFFEGVADWIWEQNIAGNLPELPPGQTAQKIEITSSGYAHAIDCNGMAKYQMQLNLLYRKE